MARLLDTIGFWVFGIGIGANFFASILLQVLWVIPAWYFSWSPIFWVHRWIWGTLVWGWWIGSWVGFWWTPALWWILGQGWWLVWLVFQYWYLFLYFGHCVFAGSISAIFIQQYCRYGFGAKDWTETQALAEFMVLQYSDLKIPKKPEEILSLDQKKLQIRRFYDPISRMAITFAIGVIFPLILQILDWKILPAFPYRFGATFCHGVLVFESARAVMSAKDRLLVRDKPGEQTNRMDWRVNAALDTLMGTGLVLLEWIVLPTAGISTYHLARFLVA